MLRYQAAALALKALSLSPPLYRRLANAIKGSTPRRTMSYPGRHFQMVRQWRHFRAPSATGRYSITEIGTGWMHFGGLYLRAFEDADVTLFDVWDNRQFKIIAPTFLAAAQWIETAPAVPDEDRARAAGMCKAIAAATDLAALYALCDARYVLNAGGGLSSLADASQDLVFSADVLEHIHADALSAAFRDQYRVLKSGGICMHQIGLDDHLAHYDPHASKKQYLAYGGREWRIRFENKVQYTNRVSLDAFRRHFADAGFEELLCMSATEPAEVAKITVAPQFRDQSEESLNATRAFLVLRKPLHADR